MKKIIAILLVIVMTLSLFVGCGQKNQDVNNENTPNSDNSQDKEKDTPKRDDLNIALSSVISSLDPNVFAGTQQNVFFKAIYDTLVNMDEKGNVQPSIAQSWEISDDKLQYTFKIKQGIKFSNGEDLTADDIVFSADRYFATPMGMYYGMYIGKIEKVDDYTVKFTTPSVYEGFFSAIANYLFVLPKDYLESNSDITVETVGSGAYVISEFIPGSEAKLTKNESYHGVAANIPKVNFKFIAETSTRIIALESGEVDIVLDPGFEDRQNLMSNNNVKFEETPSYGRYTVAMTQFGKTADAKLRQAIKCAINSEEIMMAMVDGIGVINKGSGASTTYLDYQDLVDMSSYDVEKAKECLAESTFNADKDVVAITVLDVNTQKIAEVIQNQLGKIGIKVQVDMVDAGSYYQRVAEKSVEMSISLGGGVDFGPQEDIAGFTKTQDAPDRWPDNDIVENAYAKLILTSDLEERKALVKEAYEEISNMNVLVPLFTPYTMAAYNKDLKGFILHPENKCMISKLSW